MTEKAHKGTAETTSYKCPTCDSEWPSNYCPECGGTIVQSEMEKPTCGNKPLTNLELSSTIQTEAPINVVGNQPLGATVNNKPLMNQSNLYPQRKVPPQQDRGFRRIAYYIPWTLVGVISCFVLISFLPQRSLYYADLFSDMVFSYICCALPPVILYQLLKGSKRFLAYMIHVLWFIAATSIHLLSYSAGQSDGTIITPHSIIVIRFGLKWSAMGAGSGRYASTWLLASGFIGVLYFIEKFLKEKSRRI